MIRESLWPYALQLYARPGVEPALLELQDDHGHCAPYLIWSLWLAASGRVPSDAVLDDAAALARAWQATAIGPLRALRCDLKAAAGAAPQAARDRLRNGVKALELEAERMLLQMLEDMSPPSSAPARAAGPALERAAGRWSGPSPPDVLQRLTAAATSIGS